MSTTNPNDSARIRQNRADAEAAFAQDAQTARATDDGAFVAGQGQGGRTPEEIEADIRRTRAQMDGTLGELQRKLSGARSDIVNEFAHNFTEAVVRNPIPATLVATGLVWMMGSFVWRHRVPVSLMGSAYAWRKMYGPEEGSYYRPASYQTGMGGSQDAGSVQQAKGKIADTGRRTAESVRTATSRGRERVSETSQRLSERGAQMRDQIADVTDNARAQVAHLSESARYRARRAQTNAQRMAHEQPLLAAALGLAAGALMGALLPHTRREDELMGRTRDQLLDRAREEMHEQVDKGKEAAQAVGQAATEAAKEEAKRQAGSGDASGDARPTPGM